MPVRLWKPIKLGVVLVPLAGAASFVTFASCATTIESEADADASGEAGDGSNVCPKDQAGNAIGDRCVCAEKSPALGRECSPSQPCPSELDCIYLPGCAAPKGVCRQWGRCNDSAMAFPVICGCDGMERSTRTEPFPSDPGLDTGGAPCPKDASRE